MKKLLFIIVVMWHIMPAVANERCALGISWLNVGDQISVPLWANKETDVAINVAYNGGVCYALMAEGEAEDAINIKHNNTIWHTIDEVAPAYVFELTIDDRKAYGFGISAAGTFLVDWGDGTEEVIEKKDTTYVVYNHYYSTAETHTIRLGGKATAYGSKTAITFRYLSYVEEEALMSPSALLGISGCLGCIFPTLADGTQPSFMYTFKETKITSIPDNLFDGIKTNGEPPIFEQTFSYCYSLVGPSARINGVYLYDIWPDYVKKVSYFNGTYVGTSGLDDYATMPDKLTDD